VSYATRSSDQAAASEFLVEFTVAGSVTRQVGQRARDKAEVFETALARVSTALAKATRRSAADLKAERLAAARTGATGPSQTERAQDSPPPPTSVARRASHRHGRSAKPRPSPKALAAKHAATRVPWSRAQAGSRAARTSR
jgi:hypothetical protein